MQPDQLKSMIEDGHYTPDPALVAQAMLRRRGMRTLLTATAALTPVDRTPEAPAFHRKAA